LQLLFAQLAEEFFIEDWHYATFLLLGNQLLEQDSLVILRYMRDRVHLALFGSCTLLFGRLLPQWSELLG